MEPIVYTYLICASWVTVSGNQNMAELFLLWCIMVCFLGRGNEKHQNMVVDVHYGVYS